MKLRLNYWQLLLLFLPMIACFTLGSFIFSMPSLTKALNFILLPDMCLIVSYQAYLGISFNNARPNRSTLYNFNALIPVIFYITYLLYMVYLALFGPAIRHLNNSPIRRADFNPFITIIVFFMIQAFITFFFINTPYISRQIKRIADKDEQEIFQKEFLIPMKKLLRIVIIVIVSCIIITMAVDILKTASS